MLRSEYVFSFVLFVFHTFFLSFCQRCVTLHIWTVTDHWSNKEIENPVAWTKSILWHLLSMPNALFSAKKLIRTWSVIQCICKCGRFSLALFLLVGSVTVWQWANICSPSPHFPMMLSNLISGTSQNCSLCGVCTNDLRLIHGRHYLSLNLKFYCSNDSDNEHT